MTKILRKEQIIQKYLYKILCIFIRKSLYQEKTLKSSELILYFIYLYILFIYLYKGLKDKALVKAVTKAVAVGVKRNGYIQGYFVSKSPRSNV